MYDEEEDLLENIINVVMEFVVVENGNPTLYADMNKKCREELKKVFRFKNINIECDEGDVNVSTEISTE